MILRSSREMDEPRNGDTGLRSAWEVFFQSQQNVRPPFTMLLQRAHSELAGAVMRALRPDAFGDIPEEAIEAARQHDFGWGVSDDRQVAHEHQQPPKPFPATHEEVESWERSLQLSANGPALTHVLISRHFCMLARGNENHQEFLDRETERREAIERHHGFEAKDLQRWTAAIGFSDLVSLYLCSGVNENARFPLSHPADPASEKTPKVILRWRNPSETRHGGALAFSRPVLQPGTLCEVSGQEYGGPANTLEHRVFQWTFPNG